ncbi:barstar family protein [Sphingopyxis sp. KK2]|uniref:barstar family protein n=1 Tax=Sphingopyxis sp. KK2 TaxID=1855727 RepID=UPI00097E6F02|nr:barstar family protein [Sphingopyxis sp. KK2]
MKRIPLDATGWRTTDDFFVALLTELGAPSWHGHNLNALYDSLSGGINDVEPPFAVEVRNGGSLPAEFEALFAGVAEVFADARREFGTDASFSLA